MDGENAVQVEAEPCNPKTSESLELGEDEQVKTEEGDASLGSEADGPNVETDPYFYTKRQEFTSEIYKIELGGLPHIFGYAQLKKLLNNKLNLSAHKIKPMKKFAYVNFRCEEDREKALQVLEGYKWNNNVLHAKKANPASDPLVMKRNLEDSSLQSNRRDKQPNKKQRFDDTDQDVHTRIKNVVTPLWKMDYSEQLTVKEDAVRKVLVNLARSLAKINKPDAWLRTAMKLHGNQSCELSAIRPSPVVDGYRNKCEFTVAQGPQPADGTAPVTTVGFRFASYSAGSMNVGPIDQCVNIPETMKQVVKQFEEYIDASEKQAFNPERHEGFWRQLTVRTTTHDQVMAIVTIHPQDLSQADLDDMKNSLQKHFFEGSTKLVTCLYFQAYAKRVSGYEPPFEHVYGEKHIEEKLLDMTFRISPAAFFQINSPAAEILYSTIGDLASLNSETVLLDICCGTGTIGLCLAKMVKKVIGIEMVDSAVQDAKINATLNGVGNVDFRCGKVEDLLYATLREIPLSEEVVAVVDPPRAGLHNRVIRALRSCKMLKRLVYVSCNPEAAGANNFVDLCRPESKTYQGNPFYPKIAIPIDLFPHTSNCELVVLFERTDD